MTYRKPGMFQSPSSLAVVLGLGFASWVLLAAIVFSVLFVCRTFGASVVFSTVGCVLGARWLWIASGQESLFPRLFGYCAAVLLGLLALTISGVMGYAVSNL